MSNFDRARPPTVQKRGASAFWLWMEAAQGAFTPLKSLPESKRLSGRRSKTVLTCSPGRALDRSSQGPRPSGIPLGEVVDLFERESPRIFGRGAIPCSLISVFLRSRYSRATLEKRAARIPAPNRPSGCINSVDDNERGHNHGRSPRFQVPLFGGPRRTLRKGWGCAAQGCHSCFLRCTDLFRPQSSRAISSDGWRPLG